MESRWSRHGRKCRICRTFSPLRGSPALGHTPGIEVDAWTWQFLFIVSLADSNNQVVRLAVSAGLRHLDAQPVSHLGFNYPSVRWCGEISPPSSWCWDPVYLQISRNLIVLANHPAIVGKTLPTKNLVSLPCLSRAHLMRRPFPGERSCTHDTQHSGLLSSVLFPYWPSWLDPVLLGLGKMEGDRLLGGDS